MSPSISPTFTPAFADFLALPLTSVLDVMADALEVQLNGGRASNESAYDWPYLRLCVQQAYEADLLGTETQNLALLQADYVARKRDRLESLYAELKFKAEFWDTPDQWVQSFPAPLLFDAARQEQFFVVPPAFVALQRYVNLPGENTVRDLFPEARAARSKYRFCYLAPHSRAHERLPGGLLGRYGFYHEQTSTALALPLALPLAAAQHRVYLVPPKGGLLIAPAVPLLATYVLRETRSTGLSAPPLVYLKYLNVQRVALDLALLRTRADRVIDNNPQPTQA